MRDFITKKVDHIESDSIDVEVRNKSGAGAGHPMACFSSSDFFKEFEDDAREVLFIVASDNTTTVGTNFSPNIDPYRR